MNLHSESTNETSERSLRVVRGCPCYREYGSEKVCVNNDDVRAINTILIDLSFFENMTSDEALQDFKSEKENMCYILVNLNTDDNLVYCVSQGDHLSIHSKAVKATDIDAALQFVTTTQMSQDGVICSSCLYKYLVTLGDHSEELLTQRERADVIISYVKTMAANMAINLEQDLEEVPTSQDAQRDLITTQISRLMDEKATWSERIMDLNTTNGNEKLEKLYEQYKLLSRLESVFLFQATMLLDATDELVALGQLRFMVEVAERILGLCKEIREASRNLIGSSEIDSDIISLLGKYSLRRKQTENKIGNLSKILHQVET
ncbi:MAG: hypothetical protein ACW97A_00850 [Candidatus Thorarchaeota archaeon]|jgi:hypothetical protein